MKQPLLAVAILYGAGVVLGHFLAAPLFTSFTIAFLITAVALCFAPLRPWLLAAAVFLFGWINLTTRTAVLSRHDLRAVLGSEPSLVMVRGRITESPSQRVFLRNGSEHSHTLALLEVDSIRLGQGDWQPAHGKVLSRTPGVLPPQFTKGQAVEIRGAALPPRPPVARGLFDYAKYLRSRGIYYELKTESASDWKPSGELVATPISERFRAWGQRTLARGLPEQDESVRLQWAMLLGWQTGLTDEVSESFMRSGTMHIFSISGLHIALIAGIFLALLRAAMVPRWACGAAVILVIWFYTAATGWQASAIRSTVMMSVIIAGQMLKRPANLLNSLAVAACIILVWEPEQLFQASFQLSFFVVLSLALLVPPIDKWKARLFKLDPLLPWELRPWWQRRAVKIGGWIWAGFATSLAALIGSLPLVAHYFHLLTPGSLLANLAIVPVSSLALASGLAALITGDVAPWFTECFNLSGSVFMRLMVWLSEVAANSPGAWVHVSSPGPILFVLYYGLVFAFSNGWLANKSLRWWIIAPAVALAVTWSAQWYRARSWHELTVLPVRGAHMVCVQPARGGETWWINSGNESAVEFTLKPFWQSRGGNRIDNLLLTHGDARYVGGAVELQQAFPITQTFVSPLAGRSSRYRDILSNLEKTSSVSRSATNGATLGRWQILHPDASDRFANAADNSVAALGNFDGTRVLLLMNLSRSGQNTVFTRHPQLRADIIITGLPEKEEPLAAEWLEVLRPKQIILADSEAPSHRASPELLARLRQSGADVVSTRKVGAVSLFLRNGTWRVEPGFPITGSAPEPETAAPGVQDE